MKRESNINGFKVTTKESIPANENSFCHDFYHMGVEVGKDTPFMYAATSTESRQYIIIIHQPTGKRIKIDMPKE